MGEINFTHVLARPFEEGYEGDGRFELRYMAFFKDQASADAFESSKEEDYLKNYYVYTDISYKELTEEKEAEFDKLLSGRIEEIKNSESEITPADIEGKGGKVWYVSSVRGDDSNDGKSPERPFKTLEALYDKKGDPNSPVLVSKAKPGDGVFLERGSVWYAKTYNQNSMR